MGNSLAIFASVKLLWNFMAIYRQKPITVIPQNFYSNYSKNSLSWEFSIVNNDPGTMMQGWYYVESLTGQWHDRVQTESQIATVDSCFDLIGSLQHGVASCEVCSWLTDIHKPTKCRWWWPQMKLKSKSLPIGQCHMQNAWQGTIGKIQNIMSLPR